MFDFNVWKITPGGKDDEKRLWPEFISPEERCIGINWESEGPYYEYSKEQLKELGFGKNDAKTMEDFASNIIIGDIVIANSGKRKVLGIGRISSDYISNDSSDNPRFGKDFAHIRKVEWISTNEIELGSDIAAFDIKTVTQQDMNRTDHRERFEYILEKYNLTLDPTGGEDVDTLEQITREFKAVILYGPPGTGKTWNAKRLTAKLLGLRSVSELTDWRFYVTDDQYIGRWEIVQFHPSYNYEDFIRGIQVEIDKDSTMPAYRIADRIFVEMATAAEICKEESKNETFKEESKNDNYILIIDEINRANLASVLGELIYAIEYRGKPVATPYAYEGDKTLIVPDNLFIIGTMNTADRSIGHIDYAVRRRFAFIPMLPDRSMISGKALKLFDAVAMLFKNQPERRYLSPDFHGDDVQVGHTYFMSKSPEELALKFTYQVLPLLREYYKDGILVKGDDEDIVLEIDDLKISIAKPENIEAIYSKILQWCKA